MNKFGDSMDTEKIMFLCVLMLMFAIGLTVVTHVVSYDAGRRFEQVQAISHGVATYRHIPDNPGPVEFRYLSKDEQR